MRVTVSPVGVLDVCDETGVRFSCRLLPGDREFGMQAPFYGAMTERPAACSPIGDATVAAAGDGCVVTRHFPGFALRMTVQPTADGCALAATLRREGEGPLPRMINLISLPAGAVSTEARVLLLDKLGIRPMSELQDGAAGKVIFAVQDGAHAFTLSSRADADYPLYTGYFRGAWEGIVHLPAEPAASIDLGTWTLRLGDDAQRLLDDYSRESARAENGKPIPTGWNSWNFYHSSISQEIIAENARAMAAADYAGRLRWCILDMGWETRFGEWAADPQFPDGMAAMAAEIRAQGLEPGIWFAPVVIDPECNFMQDDYRWVGMNKFGFPDRTYECCGLFGYILDVTRPEGEQWLFDLFRRFRDMGYTYFKLDFLRFLMYVDHFQDGSLTNVQIMRKALGIVRAAVGDDAYILGCNLPFEVGPGYVDGTRVSGDVALFWHSIRENARSIASTYFLNGAWWHNDPDFLVALGKDTYTGTRALYNVWWFPRQDELEADPDVLAQYRLLHDPQATLSLEEARTHVSLEILLGGALILGDPLMYLNEDGQALVRKALSAETSPGYPLCLFAEDGLPAVWVQRLARQVRIGLFNWSDELRTVAVTRQAMQLQETATTATDFWTGETVSLTGNTLSLSLPPHGCRVLEFPY